MRFLSTRGLVLCFPPHLHAHLICFSRLKTISFVFFTLVFNVSSRKKICVTGAIKLYMDDTLEEESIWMILVELEVENSPLYRSCEDFFTSKYCEDFFSSKYCCLQANDNEFPVCIVPVTDNYACRLWPSKQTRTHLCSRCQIYIKLCVNFSPASHYYVAT